MRICRDMPLACLPSKTLFVKRNDNPGQSKHAKGMSLHFYLFNRVFILTPYKRKCQIIVGRYTPYTFKRKNH